MLHPMPGMTATVAAVAAAALVALVGLSLAPRRTSSAHALRPPAPPPSSSPPPPSSSSSSSSSQPPQPPPALFRVGLLEVALPPPEGRPGRMAQMLRNEACIAAAVRQVGHQLLVAVRGADSAQAGAVRQFVSELYRQLWDAACLQNRVLFDVRVLPGPAAAGGGYGGETDGGDNGNNIAGGETGSAEAAKNGANGAAAGGGGGSASDVAFDGDNSNARLASAREGVLTPKLEVVLSDDSLFDVASANVRRAAAALPPVALVSLAAESAAAFNPAYHYLEDAAADVPQFRSVACGGTFDNLHFGHRKLLTMAAAVCDGVLTVGVTGDSMLHSKGMRHLIDDAARRSERVLDFLRTVKPALNVRIELLTDPLGPPAHEPGFDAIVVSSETVRGAEKINAVRGGNGLPPLAVVVTHRTEASSLSSTFIRRHIHDARGSKGA
ncbi:unnamed protein product [Phaeothamnion confervicola]